MKPWESLVLEKTRDGFLLRVQPSADRRRWRWSVMSLEYNTRPRMIFERAGGYRTTRERAMKAADNETDRLLKEARNP